MRKITSFLLFFIFSFSILLGEEKKFTLLNTSDEHSTLAPIPLTDYVKNIANPTLGGFARLATKVKQIRHEKGDEPVVLLSSGDIMGGSPFAWLILENKSFEIEIMQKIGYQAMTIGNHEFDYGPDGLSNYLSRAGYENSQPNMDILIANLNIPDTLHLKKIKLLPYKIYTLSNGIRLGVFGIQGAASFKLAPSAGDVTLFDQFEIGKKTVEQMRKEGADVVVLLSHSGIEEDKQMAQKIQGIDIILGGHDHIKTPQPIIENNTIIVHPSYYLQYVGQLNLSFDTETKKVKLLNDELKKEYLQILDDKVEEDSTIASIIQSATSELNQFINQYSGGQLNNISENIINLGFEVKKDADYKETTIGNFVTDAMRIVGSKVTKDKVDIAIQGNGVIRADIITGTLDSTKGKFALYDLLTVVGLGKGPDNSAGYPMVSCYLTEKEIFNLLEVTAMLSQVYGDMFFLQFSGLKYTYDPGKAMWLKIPFINTPIPANKAIKSVFLYTGEGIQDNSNNYIELHREGKRLFHVVTDYYVAQFLPMVGKVLPKLEIKFKDKNQKVLTLEEAVVLQENGSEYKIWQAIATYAKELNQMPPSYKSTQNRIVKEEGIPYKVWSYTLIAIIIGAIIFLIRKFLKRKTSH
ncbi:MAG: 5'-nucleotidase C-terminal domain-containing protein [Chitinophagales bacterium]|nr:5'-nucleotidase C-terminal domain-containing protein [Chitinophagales bacterium]MCZ2392342.1 5'-nucleotidase C-terminal domain-containing protein [Chitinophagales bacterium]